MAHDSQVYSLRCSDGMQSKITVHYGFKLCGLIACHLCARLGNSMSPTLLWFSATLGMLGSNMGP
jgi:hypothetical protein